MPIYMDYNATTPIDPEVRDAMRPFLDEEFGNPSSTHFYGIMPRKALVEAREMVSSFLRCKTEEIIFTGGGTESNNHAIKGAAYALKARGNHIITSAIEHPAVLEVCSYLELWGFDVTYLPVDSDGIVDLKALKAALRDETVLITIMHANNETGSIQTIEEISAIARDRGVLMHTDAAQSAGKIPVHVDDLGVDLLSLAGHKVYAPKGIGVLYVRKGTDLEKMIHGASQEAGMRAGTENIPYIAGLGKACEIAGHYLKENRAHMLSLRDSLFDKLKTSIDGMKLNGNLGKCLPNTLSISFKGIDANTMLKEIGLDVAASAGAACHSGSVEMSHVLRAMGIPPERGLGTIRLSVGRMSNRQEIDRAADVIIRAINPNR